MLDSRTKIGAAVPAGATVVRGYFDPLLACHAERLARCKRPLAVVVADPPDSLLPLASRQLLVAALKCVAAVVVDPGVVTEDWTADDLETRREFIEHVHARSQA